MRKNFTTKIITMLFIFSLANISNISYVYAGLFDNKIKVKKCYRANFKFKSGERVFKNYKHSQNHEMFQEVDLTAEIDLKKEIVIIESIFANKVTISRHAMLSATDNFVSTVPDYENGTWVFDLRKETISGRGSPNVVRWIGDGVYKCDFN